MNPSAPSSPAPSQPFTAAGAFAATLEPLTHFVPIGTTVVDWASLPERNTPNGIFRPAFDSPAPTLERFEVHVTTLKPGANPHSPHYHPWEEILVMKEGVVEVWINGTVKRASAGAVIFFASNDAHTVWNQTGEPATYFVINFHANAARSGGGQSGAQADRAAILPSSVVQWAEPVVKSGKHDAERVFVDAKTTTFSRLTIRANTAAPGSFPVQNAAGARMTLVIVREGLLESTVAGVPHLVGAGSMIVLAPQTVQTLRNPGVVPTSYFVLAAASAETLTSP